MKVYDLHCDTISAIYEGRKEGKKLTLASSSLQVDLEKMKKGDYQLQTFAIFLDRANTEDCFATAREMAELFQEELEKTGTGSPRSIRIGIFSGTKRRGKCLLFFHWRREGFLKNPRKISGGFMSREPGSLR